MTVKTDLNTFAVKASQNTDLNTFAVKASQNINDVNIPEYFLS